MYAGHGFLRLAFLIAGAGYFAASASATNIVENGGFETGDFTGWIASSTSNNPWTVKTGSNAFSGSYYASTGCVGPQCLNGLASQQASLAQTLTTEAGDTYTLTFEFNTGGYGEANELLVEWDGSTVLDLGPNGTLGVVGTPGVYTLYAFTGLVGTGSDTLTFLGRQDPGYDELDNVDVELSNQASTPEPATWTFLVSGIAAAALLKRRFDARH